MSFLSFIVIGNLLCVLFNISEAIICPSSYSLIFNGCYKMHNGTNLAWFDAREYCINETYTLGTNKTGSITHLVALESATEIKSLLFWMKAWGIQSQFWIDGVISSSTWNWSNQPITWYFNASDEINNHNGSYYQIVYNTAQNTYIIIDEINNKLSSFICEYQEQCETNNSCQNNATCYLNVGRELCICAAGFTGTLCEQQIDECLSSPCQHGGECTDGLNNYTCDCSDIFFHGPNCEIPDPDPTESQRSAAFWSVFGVVCGLVVLLTLSDLPWDEIAAAIGCPWYRFQCCLNHDDDNEGDIDMNSIRSPDSTANENNFTTKQIIMPGTTAKGINYHIMNTVWNPEQLRIEIPLNPQINEYRSLDQSKTPDNALIRSFASVFMAKQKQKELEQKRVYAVDITEQNNSTLKTKDPVMTMINWTQQLQEKLKPRQSQPTSASSTRELI